MKDIEDLLHLNTNQASSLRRKPDVSVVRLWFSWNSVLNERGMDAVRFVFRR